MIFNVLTFWYSCLKSLSLDTYHNVTDSKKNPYIYGKRWVVTCRLFVCLCASAVLWFIYTVLHLFTLFVIPVPSINDSLSSVSHALSARLSSALCCVFETRPKTVTTFVTLCTKSTVFVSQCRKKCCDVMNQMDVL